MILSISFYWAYSNLQFLMNYKTDLKFAFNDLAIANFDDYGNIINSILKVFRYSFIGLFFIAIIKKFKLS